MCFLLPIYLPGCLDFVINWSSFYMLLISNLFHCVYFEYLISITFICSKVLKNKVIYFNNV